MITERGTDASLTGLDNRTDQPPQGLERVLHQRVPLVGSGAKQFFNRAFSLPHKKIAEWKRSGFYCNNDH